MAYTGPICDVDIHHQPKSQAEIVRYLPKQWRDYVTANAFEAYPLLPPLTVSALTTVENAAVRTDTFPPEGGPPGSSYAMLRDQVLDKFGYYRGVLTFNVGQFGAHLNPYFASAVCSAANDWNLENWIGLDDRLYTTVCISTANPNAAAAEIRRIGSHPRISSVLLCGNGIGRPFGDELYHPIYEAAHELGLAIQVHVNASDKPSAVVSVAAGAPDFNQEFNSVSANQAMTFISSFITHGVFEKFPNLKLLIKEYGITWLPYLSFMLDQEYKLLRTESPWVKKLPSEYMRRHVKLDTQPIEEGPRRNSVIELLETLDGVQDMLCFATDYPHFTQDDPRYVSRLFPESWHRKLFCDNACDLYGWPKPQVWPPAQAAAHAIEGA